MLPLLLPLLRDINGARRLGRVKTEVREHPG